MSNCYLVAVTPASTLDETRVKRVFPNAYRVNDHAWLIGTEISTCGEVSERVREGSDDQTGCLVVRVDDYNGFGPRTLWERIGDWGGK